MYVYEEGEDKGKGKAEEGKKRTESMRRKIRDKKGREKRVDE